MAEDSGKSSPSPGPQNFDQKHDDQGEGDGPGGYRGMPPNRGRGMYKLVPFNFVTSK